MGVLALITDGVNPVGVDHFCVSVEGYEPDAVSEKLKRKGIPSQRLYSPNQVYVRDPDGILVQLAG
jgi:catechol 2,3-dioxygenase-like lactoylglutathione lyase family enzyme